MQEFGARFFRVGADIAILSLAFALGVGLDNLWRRSVRDLNAPALSTVLAQVGWSLAVLVVLSLLVFSISGFYTRGRLYSSRYKALVVLQGTGVAFLLFAAAAYAFKAYMQFPTPAAIALMAVLAAGMLVAARLYAPSLARALQDPADLHPRLAVEDADVRQEPLALIIGGAGYIGSALIPRLLETGYRVRVFDSLLFGTQAIDEFLIDDRVDLVKGDFRRIDQLVVAMAGVDSVVHLGGLVGDPACAVDEDLTIEINLSATRAVAEVAKAHQVRRFVFASTCSVYGASDDIMTERSRLNPVSLYAKSKIASEQVLADLSDHGFKPVVLRFGTVYGLSGRTRFDLVVNLLTAKAVVEGQITVFGPDQWRPFVHVSDVARAVALVMAAPHGSVDGRVYNVGSNEQNTTLGEVGQRIQRQVPTAELVVSDGDADRRNYRVDFDRIANELGFRPEWSLDEGIAQMKKAVEEGGIDNYHDREYSNVKTLEHLLRRDTMAVYRQRELEMLESTRGYAEVEAAKAATSPEPNASQGSA